MNSPPEIFDVPATVIQDTKKILKAAPPDVKDLLCIIIDYDANQSYLHRDSDLLSNVVNYLIVIANIHLMQHLQNAVAIFGCSGSGANYIYPEDNYNLVSYGDSQLPEFATVDYLVRTKLNELMYADYQARIGEQGTKPIQYRDNLLCGSLSMALAYVNRCRKTSTRNIPVNARILIVSGSKEFGFHSSNQHMNLFLNSAKMDVVVDVCTLEVDTKYMLRHAAEITRGFYFVTSDFENLGMNLLSLFLVPPEKRPSFGYPKQSPTDMRAICSCHNEFIGMGFACSSCLTVFCKYTPICISCGIVFKPPQKLQWYIKRKNTFWAKRKLKRDKELKKILDTISSYSNTYT